MTQYGPDKNLLDDKTLAMIRRVGGDELLIELSGIFLNTVPGKIEEARKAVEDSDCRTAARIYHSLVSLCGNIGAKSMMTRAQKLEKWAENENSEVIPPVVNELEADFAKVKENLTLLIDDQRNE